MKSVKLSFINESVLLVVLWREISVYALVGFCFFLLGEEWGLNFSVSSSASISLLASKVNILSNAIRVFFNKSSITETFLINVGGVYWISSLLSRNGNCVSNN